MNLKENALKGLNRVIDLYNKDLAALPEEAFDKSFGPKARTVADFMHEINMVNDSLCKELRGEGRPEWPDEGWVKAPENLKSKAAVLEAFQASSDAAVATVESLPESAMEEIVKTEMGEFPKVDRIRFMSIHLWYHLGQINFIQTLLGDDEWHWG